jgi:hypothetical protein
MYVEVRETVLVSQFYNCVQKCLLLDMAEADFVNVGLC